MLTFVEIGQSAAGQHLVTLDQLKGFNIGGRGHPLIDRPAKFANWPSRIARCPPLP
jgi:hypothetical protein